VAEILEDDATILNLATTVSTFKNQTKILKNNRNLKLTTEDSLAEVNDCKKYSQQNIGCRGGSYFIRISAQLLFY
jgi:hypothetical protein